MILLIDKISIHPKGLLSECFNDYHYILNDLRNADRGQSALVVFRFVLGL